MVNEEGMAQLENHLMCAFKAAIRKMMKCSGFEEILVESGICASSSIQKVNILIETAIQQHCKYIHNFNVV